MDRGGMRAGKCVCVCVGGRQQEMDRVGVGG